MRPNVFGNVITGEMIIDQQKSQEQNQDPQVNGIDEENQLY